MSCVQKNVNIMKPLLSIIIPCYNCEDTLEIAVESCFNQGLNSEFEIIMIDDGSVDNTREVMKKLAKVYTEIKLFFNDKNNGGGATRNRGIVEAKGDLIYCLDSDNIFAPNSLKSMVDYLIDKKCDGVVFHERRFFIGKNTKRYSSHFNTILDRPVKLEDIFNTSDTLLDNFLFTKKSFLKTQGFPEHHGFDTQGFEMRYLATDNIVYVCIDSIFYHRQAAKNKSYFEREYNAGNFSLFYYYCIEDIFDKLSLQGKKLVINYDIFTNSSLKNNILKELKHLEKDGLLMKKETSEMSTNHHDLQKFTSAIKLYKDKQFSQALNLYTEILASFPESKVLYYNCLRCIVGISGIKTNEIEKRTLEKTNELIIKPQKLYKSYHRNPIFRIIFNLIRNKNK